MADVVNRGDEAGENLDTCFFFFQAEDGIRDVAVTGVQTCALPIYRCRAAHRRLGIRPGRRGRGDALAEGARPRVPRWAGGRGADRSEEHTSELQSRLQLLCRLLLGKKKK